MSNLPANSTKEKFLPIFIDFISVLAFDIPKIFFTAHPLYRHSHFKRKSIDQGIHNLYYRGYLTKKNQGFIFTPKGEKWLSSNYLYLKNKNKTWDKKWRVILFDIPSELQKKRHSLRHRLKSINAFMIQKSVFVFPYSCEEEIAQWCRELNISDHIEVILTDSIGSREPYAKKHFGLK